MPKAHQALGACWPMIIPERMCVVANILDQIDALIVARMITAISVIAMPKYW